jgi:hypothetical protein
MIEKNTDHFVTGRKRCNYEVVRRIAGLMLIGAFIDEHG